MTNIRLSPDLIIVITIIFEHNKTDKLSKFLLEKKGIVTVLSLHFPFTKDHLMIFISWTLSLSLQILLLSSLRPFSSILKKVRI